MDERQWRPAGRAEERRGERTFGQSLQRPSSIAAVPFLTALQRGSTDGIPLCVARCFCLCPLRLPHHLHSLSLSPLPSPLPPLPLFLSLSVTRERSCAVSPSRVRTRPHWPHFPRPFALCLCNSPRHPPTHRALLSSSRPSPPFCVCVVLHPPASSLSASLSPSALWICFFSLALSTYLYGAPVDQLDQLPAVLRVTYFYCLQVVGEQVSAALSCQPLTQLEPALASSACLAEREDLSQEWPYRPTVEATDDSSPI